MLLKKVWFYQSFGIFILNLIDAADIKITTSQIGFEGRNDSKLVCTVTMLREDTFFQVAFKYGSFIIVNFHTTGPELTDSGKYLEGRVILEDVETVFINDTHVQSEARIVFTDLRCIDDNFYSCLFSFGDSTNNGLPDLIHSSAENLTVIVFPSTPLNLTITQYTNHINVSNFDAKLEVNSVQQAKVNDNMLGTRKYTEGDNITVFCAGQVGYPPGTIMAQKISVSGIILNITADNDPVNVESGNCSYYQNRSFTVNLSAEDNNAIFRCRIKSLFYDNKDFIETSNINVEYPVRAPRIVVDKENDLYPPLMLSCNADGNPEPEYSWYKFQSNEGGWNFYSIHQNITLTSYTDRGVYKCDVNNTIRHTIYKKSTAQNITFLERPPHITKTPDQAIYAEGMSKIELQCLSPDYLSQTYRWIIPDGNITSGNMFVITNASVNQSGIYTCLLIVTASDVVPTVFTLAEKITIGNQRETEFERQMGFPCDKVAAILGSVFGTLGFVVFLLLLIAVFLRNSSLRGNLKHPKDNKISKDEYQATSSGSTGQVNHYDEITEQNDKHDSPYLDAVL